MMKKELYKMALGISAPWYIEDLRFDAEQNRLEIVLNFRRGGSQSGIQCIHAVI